MAKRESFEDFAKKWGSMTKRTEQKTKSKWNQQLLKTMDRARLKTPVTTGNLDGSNVIRKATLTRTGIKSALVFIAPYAKRLHDDIGVMLKPVGADSIWQNGKWIKKKRKGIKGWLQKAVDKTAPDFMNILDEAIGDSFNEV